MNDTEWDRIDVNGHNPTTYLSYAEMRAVEKGEVPFCEPYEGPVEEEEISPELAMERMERLRQQGLSLKQAAKQAAEELGLPKNKLYDLALGKEIDW